MCVSALVCVSGVLSKKMFCLFRCQYVSSYHQDPRGFKPDILLKQYIPAYLVIQPGVYSAFFIALSFSDQLEFLNPSFAANRSFVAITAFATTTSSIIPGAYLLWSVNIFVESFEGINVEFHKFSKQIKVAL